MVVLAIVADLGLVLARTPGHAVVAAEDRLMDVIGWFTRSRQLVREQRGPEPAPRAPRRSPASRSSSAALIAIPVGLFIGHTGRGATVAVALGNLGRAIPSYALLVIFVPLLGIGFPNALAALCCCRSRRSSPTPTRACRASTGTWSRPGGAWACASASSCRRVEVPLALPVIVAGFRDRVRAGRRDGDARPLSSAAGARPVHRRRVRAARHADARRRGDPRRRPRRGHGAVDGLPRGTSRVAWAPGRSPIAGSRRARGRAGRGAVAAAATQPHHRRSGMVTGPYTIRG